MKAKYYIYRNLHKDCFSVRYKGIVVGHIKSFIANNVVFKVNQVGRARVIQEKVKNVHAFVVCDSFEKFDEIVALGSHEVTYNPYHYGSFVMAETKEPIHVAGQVLGVDNKLWLFN